jgi:Tol biopolymer transport system component
VYSSESVQPFYPYGRAGFGELWVVNVASGARRQLTRLPLDAVQPRWSPNGHRVAFWGLRPGGQRDLWTVSPSGGESSVVAATDDADLDWNPAWAADGRSLYFASDRGGAMGVFRMAIDEASGKASGAPQPLAIPLPFASYLSLTRDGRRLLLSSASVTDSVERIAFDPKSARARGPSTTVFASSLRLFTCALSADGGRIALATAGRREDLFVLQADGSGLRQLTNDAHKDRGPAFFPDGQRLLFYSNRSGRYEAWSLRLDGSGLTQLTGTSEHEVTEAELSPDGSRLAVNLSRGTGIASMTGALPVAPVALPDTAEGNALEYPEWSPDGRLLAGVVRHASGRSTLAVYSLEAKSYRALDIEGGDPLRWLASGRHLLFWRKGRVLAVDLQSGRAHDVFDGVGDAQGPALGELGSYDLPADEGAFYAVRSRTQADIWQVTLP